MDSGAHIKTIFFTIIGDNHWKICRTDEFIASFKRFHPDLELVIFGQHEIREAFTDNEINFYSAKAYFANKLHRDRGPFDLIVNMDADHIVCGRMNEIMEGDYDVAAPANWNAQLNAGILIETVMGEQHAEKPLNKFALTESHKYLQGGLIASTSRRFWEDYEYASRKIAQKFSHKENDVLNVLCSVLPYKVKVLEGAYEYTDPSFKCYYGCSSLFREKQMIVEDGSLTLDGKPVRAYHYAFGGNKRRPEELFTNQVLEYLRGITR